MDYKALSNYIFELGTLKKFAHCGTKLAGVRQPDTIAEHCYRTAIIGYILAAAEKTDLEKTVLMCLLHDNAEARICDLHKVARRYLEVQKAEKKAFQEQVQNLPSAIAKHFFKIFEEYEDKTSPEAIVARDADMLETAFQAKEYLDIGYKACQDWIDNVNKCLKTRTAKKLLKTLQKTPFTDWWRGLKKITDY